MNNIKTLTDKVTAAIELLETESGIREIFNAMLIDDKGNLQINTKEGLFERFNSVWNELVNTKKEGDIAEAKAMIDKLRRMGVEVSASDLGLVGVTASNDRKTPKKTSDAVKMVIWYRDASGEVQTAQVGQKGGMSGEPKEFVDNRGIKRTEVLVKGENETFLEIGKHLTKEEFEAAYPAK
ncbi:hypothetical protein [Aeromonas veronii]|uniref:hypothetical protein n=1 Tax=Aeromonas veronii TaxID=654 RepID=UPI003D1CB34C